MARNGKGQEGERNRADRDLRKGPTALPYSTTTAKRILSLSTSIPTVGIEVFFLAGIQSRCAAQEPHIFATRLPGTPFHLLPAEQKSPISFIMSKMENGSSADLSDRIPTVGILSLAFIATHIHIYILLFLLILSRFERQLTNAIPPANALRRRIRVPTVGIRIGGKIKSRL